MAPKPWGDHAEDPVDGPQRGFEIATKEVAVDAENLDDISEKPPIKYWCLLVRFSGPRAGRKNFAFLVAFLAHGPDSCPTFWAV